MIDWKAFKAQADTNPKKILTFVIALASCFFLMWAFILTQVDVKADPEKSFFTETESETETITESETDSTAQVSKADQILASRGNTAKTELPEPMPIPNVLPIAVLLILVLGGFWIIKKRKTGAGSSEFFELLGTQHVGVNQQLSLVHINGEYWVLGISSGQVTLLHRYDENQWTGLKKPEPASTTPIDQSFLSLLKRENKTYDHLEEKV